MSNASDFVIENGVLTEYVGPGGDVVVPEGVTKMWSFYGPVFNKHKKVQSITLPTSLKEFNPAVFYFLKELKWVECKGEVKLENDSSGFSGCKSLVYVICNPNTPLSSMPQKWKLWLSVGVTKYMADGNSVDPNALNEVLKYFKSQNKKQKLYKICYEYPFVAAFMIDQDILSEEQYDEMISYAQENKLLELLTMLIEGRSKRYPSETLIERVEKRIDQEIAITQKMNDHTSTTYLRSQWTWKKREDGSLIIWTYKGNDAEVFIPAAVGKNKVTAIRGRLFISNHFERNEWLRLNLHTIHLEEGITEIGDGGMNDAPIAEFAKPIDIYLPQSVVKICRTAFASKCWNNGRMRWELRVNNVTIHAPAGSYAEQYAKELHIPFIAE